MTPVRIDRHRFPSSSMTASSAKAPCPSGIATTGLRSRLPKMRRRCRAAPSPGPTACRRLDPFEVGLACVWRHDAQIKYLAAGGATALQHEPPRAQMRTKHGFRAWTVGGRRCGHRFAGIMKGVSPSIGSRPRSGICPSLNHAPGPQKFQFCRCRQHWIRTT